MSSWADRTHSKVAAVGLGQMRLQLVEQLVPLLCEDILGGTTGEQDRPHNPGFWYREIKPQNL